MSSTFSIQAFFGIPPQLLATLKVEAEENVKAVELSFINTEIPRCNVVFKDPVAPRLQMPVSDAESGVHRLAIDPGIPDWVGAAIGVPSTYLQKVTLQFSDDDFCLACAEFILGPREIDNVGAVFNLNNFLVFYGSFEQ